ncbi:polymorphic toxin-type HINT domain-containing protein [Micromonospora sp. CA-263727]|uniref:polymorphic toxin-type HINT domain-containing protein n=1 Tax=Micromonospora sp. CA-263727 TaxID=3239967 RepID=UPI003D8DF9CC
MANGSWRAIQDIEHGDLVVAKDPATGFASLQPVLDVIVGQGARRIIAVEVGADSAPSIEIRSTASHPFYVQGRGWTAASDLGPGVALLAIDSSWRVTGVNDHGYLRDMTVYNLNVGNVHTYLVGGPAAAIVVHNDSCRDIAGWTSHGRQRARERGISEDMARSAVRSGRRTNGNSPGTTKYTGRKVWVVLNRKCEVVSCGWIGRR